MSSDDEVTCSDQSQRLLSGDAHLSPIELKYLQQARIRDKLRQHLAKILSPFCRKFPVPAFKIKSATIPAFYQVTNPNNALVSEADFDINNDGTSDQVFQLSGSSTYFPGSYRIAFTRPIRHTQRFLRFIGRQDYYDAGSEATQMIQWNGIFVASPITRFELRSTENIPFIYKGITYI